MMCWSLRHRRRWDYFRCMETESAEKTLQSWQCEGGSIIFPERTMLPFHQIESFLHHTPVPMQDIVLELRNLIAEVASDAMEVVRWGGLSYFHEGRGGIVSAGICQIGLHENHVRLGFIHGAFLPDPNRLLSGTQKAKRFVRIETYEDAPWDDLKELIAASAKFDPRLLSVGQGKKAK